MLDTTACITSWRTERVAELGVGAGSAGHQMGTATPRGVACGDPSAPLSRDVPRGLAGPSPVALCVQHRGETEPCVDILDIGV